MPVPQTEAVTFGSPPITLPRTCAGILGHFNFSHAVYAFSVPPLALKACKLLNV